MTALEYLLILWSGSHLSLLAVGGMLLAAALGICLLLLAVEVMAK